jgi:predicted phage terminase large subunit-like protein
LANQVHELVLSLGIKANIRNFGPTKFKGKEGKDEYRVEFYFDRSARLPRKAKDARNRLKRPHNYIRYIDHAESNDTVCIEVDSSNHMFLCGKHMIPTHNSTYVSVLFPAWYLCNHPTHSYLAATHSGEFAARWGRKVRNDILAQQVNLNIFMSPDSQASDRWSLIEGGEYYGVGAGASISGFRADVAAIDDPFGSREDAYSPNIRAKRWEWYSDDFSPRVKPSGKRIVMATRWHEDDISGKILQQIEAQKKDPDYVGSHIRYEILSIPAISESENDPLDRPIGQYLWDDPDDRLPGGWNYGKYLRTRQKETTPMMWSALYQQRPAPESGDFFKEEWLKPYSTPISPKDAANRELAIYGASDYAVSSDGGDYTVHLVVGVDHENNMYLLDIWRGQASPDIWIEEFCKMVIKWSPREWGEESGQIKSAVGPFLGKRQMETNAFVFRRSFPSKSDKGVRAQAIRGRMAVQGLYVNTLQPYYEAFRAELLSFPAGKHDDQVDALSLLGQMLDHIVQGEAPPPPPEPPRFLKDITLDELWENQPQYIRHGRRL